MGVLYILYIIVNINLDKTSLDDCENPIFYRKNAC